MSADEKVVPTQPWHPGYRKPTTITVKFRANGHTVVASGEVAPFEDMAIRSHDRGIQAAPKDLTLREIFRQVAYSLPGLHPSDLPDGTEIHLHLRAAVIAPVVVHRSPVETKGSEGDSGEE